jgi:hypothetical protein
VTGNNNLYGMNIKEGKHVTRCERRNENVWKKGKVKSKK